MAWLSTWNRESRSRTKSLKTVMVISFSGSSRTYTERSAKLPLDPESVVATYVAFQQGSQLTLYHLGFPQEALLDRKLL